MVDVLINRNDFFKFGYCVIRNFLNNKEIQRYISIMDELNKRNRWKSTVGMHNYKECWDILVHERLLNIIRNLLGPNISYLYNSHLKEETENEMVYSWHRDNVCRIFGKGPDWDPNEPYNVLRVGIYLSSFESTGSGLNVIPLSHKKRYTLSHVLRLLHFKTKNTNIPFLRGIRKKLEKYIGVNIHTNPGDCVIFLANLFHAGIPSHGSRKSLFLSYGVNNKHSKNYVNYYIKHLKQFIMHDKKMREDFAEFLKRKNIFYPLPEKKEEIEGVSISR
jgi:hypothetical protein